MANSSSPFAPLPSCSRSVANDARLAPRIARYPSYQNGLWFPSSLAGTFGLLEVGEEPVNHVALPHLVGQRFADDPAGQLGSERAHLSSQRRQGLLTLRLDLGLGGLGDAARIRLGLGAHLGDDLRA